MTLPNDEQVRFDILIEAKAALKALQEILKHTEDNRMKIIQFTQAVVQQSKLWGVSWQQALNVYKQLNAELSKQHRPNLFGNVGGQNLIRESEKYLQALDQAGRLQDKVGDSAKKMGDSMEHSTKRAARGIDAVRIALGALVAMLIFRVINTIEMTFRKAIELATQYEDTLYRLRNVEQSLSMEGIEISMKGLKKGITDIQKLLPIFSKEDVSQLVGTLAISTKQLGLSEQQILDLAKAIGILNIRSEKQEELSATAQHVLSSILTGNARGITALGIAFTDNVMRAKAMELGFLKAGESLSTLTENEKGITKLNIILESTGTELANVGDYLDSNSAKLQENKAAWNDMLTTLGQVILPFIPVLTEFFQALTGGLNAGKVVIIEFAVRLAMLAEVMRTVFSGDFANFAENLKKTADNVRSIMTNKLFTEVPENAPEWFKRGWGDLIKQEAETATSGVNQFAEATKELDTSALEKIVDIFRDTANAIEDLAIKLNQKLADLETEYARKRADAETDYLRKVEDINKDYENDLARLRNKHRREDQQDEEKYQLALWELRMRYLMNLEDALHARDARQVIRLMKQYEIDKEALRRKKELEDKNREEQQASEIEDLELQRQRRLEDARLEYEQKLADLNVAKQREAEDLAKWYEREFADLQLAQDRKIKELLAGWAKEQEITEANAAAVYAILQKYFGPGGYTDELYQYMVDSLLQITSQAAALASQLGSLGGRDMSTEIPTPSDTGGSSGGGGGGSSGGGRAQGGTLLATRPTNATFGEAGPELVTFTPLNRMGADVGKIFGGTFPNAGAGGGMLKLEVLLSPDLEARVVEKSMNGVADVIIKVTDSK